MHAMVKPQAGGPTVLILEGEIDLAVAEVLRKLGEGVLAENPNQSVHVDMSAVTFLDSTGIGALVHIRNTSPHGVYVVHPSRAVRRTLELTGLVDSFTPPS